MSEIHDKLAKVFGEVMEVDASVVGDDTSPDVLDAWDSMAHVQLVAAIEKAFEVSMSPDEAVELESFAALREWLEAKLATG